MVELDKNFHDNRDDIALGREVVNTLPQPIAEILSEIENEDNPQLRLQRLCLSIIPLTFQYFALILSSEYLFSEDPPDLQVMDSLWGMMRRPGPGKWVNFLRSVTQYFIERDSRVIPEEAIRAFTTTLLSDRRPRAVFSDGKRLDYYEALINVRNRFAHSRQIPKERAGELFDDHFLVWKALITLLVKVFEPRVLIADETLISYHSFDTRDFNQDSIQPSDTGAALVLWNDTTHTWLQLFPLVIAMYEPEALNGEALLLEEVKDKTLFYLFRDTVVKRKEEFRHLSQLLDSRTVQVENISSDELTASILGERIDRITQKNLMDFEDALKHIPGMFVERKTLTERLDAWLADEHPGCILVGEPGVGKTSLVADWCVQRRKKGDHVLLLEASKFDHSDLPKNLENLLNLRSPLKDCLSSVYEEIRGGMPGREPKRFIVVIDAINEFVGTGVDNRTVLWREVNSLIDRIDDYRPYFKCLVTTRSDSWKSDFPKKDSADYSLKRRLYFGDGGAGFPRLAVGLLTPDEAGEIYEKARASVPGMSPVTPYNDLPESARRLMRNPFSLRLVLQTYNDREVPALTDGKLTREFAKEKVLEEQGKKDILFRLFERMLEVHKTEITIDEFLHGEKTGGKANKKDEELERIIFDPRPTGPYKKLLAEGILEERHAGEGENIEERITFSQEKLANLMDVEKKRNYRVIFQKKNIMVILFLFVVLPLIIPISEFMWSHKELNLFQIGLQEKLSFSTISHEQQEMVLIKIMTLLKNYYYQKDFIKFLYMWDPLWITLLVTFINIFIGYYLLKIMPMDLPKKFIKERFATFRDYKDIIVTILLFVVLCILLINKINIYERGYISFDIFSKLVFDLFVLYLIYYFSTSYFSDIFVVVRYSKTPQSAYFMFGLHQTIKELIQLIVIVSIISLAAFFSGKIPDIDEEIQKLWNDWQGSNEYTVLYKKSQINEVDRTVLLYIDHKLPRTSGFILMHDLLKIFLKSFLIVMLYFIPLLILKSLIARPLEKFLRWKLARFP